jgi:elongation factor Ts
LLNLAHDLAEAALNLNSKEELLASDFGGMTVADKLVEQTGVIGEKLDINAFEKIEAPFVGLMFTGNKIAALVGLSANVEGADVVAKDVLCRCATMNPDILLM